jgi:hypothetical protein
MPVPCPAGLSLEEIQACERFGQLTGLTPFFDHRPTHRGQHGFLCEACSAVLEAKEAEKARPAPSQPWELKRAA